MATITKELTIDVAKLNTFAAIVAKQYDRTSRFLKVTLANEEEEMSIDTSAVVVINARREDDASKSFAGTVNDDGTVTVPLTYWMLELDGTVKCDISIYEGDEVVLSTTLFELEVQESAADEDSDIDTDDEDYGILLSLISQVSTALSEIETATTAAEEATTSATEATTAATEAATAAEEATTSATEATTAATEAATAAEEAAEAANTAATEAEEAISTVTALGLSVVDGKICITYDEEE